MSEITGSTRDSPIGDGVATDLVYKSQHATIMFAGTILARLQNIQFQINKNIEKFHEIGTTSPLYVEGELDYTGSFDGLYFDQSKIRIAIGREKDYVGSLGGKVDVLSAVYTKAATDALASVDFGNVGTWPQGFKFDVVVQIHRSSSDDKGFTQFVLKNCMVDTYDFAIPLNRAINEKIAFVFHGIEGRRFP
jgi:hypothetical protein